MNFSINLKEIKNNLFKKENFFFSAFMIIIFVFDRLTKSKMINNIEENVVYVNDFINFDLIWNIGIGFGLLSTNTSLLYNSVSLVITIIILILIYIFTLSNIIDKFIYSAIIGGALGNLYDRIIYNAVPDFIDLHYNNFHWFTFNVADVFITMGIIIFIIRGFFIKN